MRILCVVFRHIGADGRIRAGRIGLVVVVKKMLDLLVGISPEHHALLPYLRWDDGDGASVPNSMDLFVREIHRRLGKCAI
jgi:hypothetical protein